ncbi:MAG: hypothetical protein HYV90_05900 [Candidatus Woesebacteria bacterium]|nr:MAG: hypothetical protein HYV90_05900 [Candidatus Woesebacteria bacterium]
MPRGYSRYVYAVHQYIDSLPDEEQKIAREWRGLAMEVNGARTGGLTAGYVAGSAILGFSLLLILLAFPSASDWLLGLVSVLAVTTGIIYGVRIQRKKYDPMVVKAVEDVKAKLLDPAYRQWWEEHMASYDYEGHAIIASIANTSE